MYTTEINRATHAAFAEAWRRKDVDGLMALVTDDVVYAASVGSEPGATYRGRDEVRRGFEQMLSHDRLIASHDRPLTIVGDLGFAEWEYIVERSGGDRAQVRGIDVFHFAGGRISLKDAFRKSYS
jgi:ketosteroid isomerase-like protein